jgi:eukaryotic-like serine/threonine-protein kinase
MPLSPDLVGRTVARRYCIEQHVGGGAMGDVYRARHVGLGTDVALKIMRPSIAGESEFKERFYREAKAASRLDHPNSVRVLDYGQEDDGLVYLAMEFLRGRDLLEVIREDWPLRDERIVDILAQTLAAIGAAHGHGIVHRDLKPENIMIVPDGDDEHHDRVKVCDFGIAKLIDARAFKSAEDVKTELTTGNVIIGTPEYMSPEQARGESLDARSDLYSVGVILYRMLTNRLPFDAENAIGIAVKHIVEEPLAPSRVAPNVNPRLEEICLRALRKDPRQRHASAKEMRAGLRAALGPASSSRSDPGFVATPPPTPARASLLETAATVSDGFAPRAPASPAPEPAPDSTRVVLPLDSSRRVLAGVAGVLVLLAVGSGIFFWKDTPSHGAGLVPSAIASAPAAVSSLAPVPETAAPDSTAAPPLAVPAPTIARVAPRSTAASPAVPITHAPSIAPAPAPPPPAPTSSQPTPVAPASASAPPPTPPPPDYRPANALVTREPLIADRVQRDVLERKLAELAPRLNDCYRDALYMAGSPVGGHADIHMSIDPSGHIVSVVTAPQLPSFQRCVGRLVSSITIPAQAVEAGGGTAEQGLKLVP